MSAHSSQEGDMTTLSHRRTPDNKVGGGTGMLQIAGLKADVIIATNGSNLLRESVHL